jgi:hypothetical protein
MEILSESLQCRQNNARACKLLPEMVRFDAARGICYGNRNKAGKPSVRSAKQAETSITAIRAPRWSNIGADVQESPVFLV